MDRLQARILRDIAQQDQQQAARRDGHRCDYTCDCEEWIEIPLDSTHCPSPPPVVHVNGFTLGVLLSCIFWGAVLVILCAVWEAVS